MFWAKARRAYGSVTKDDPDVRTFQRLSREFQTDVYRGLAGRLQDNGHRWIAQRTRPGTMLEIGFGAGRHRLFHRGDKDSYYALEFSSVHCQSENWRAMKGRCVVGDARCLPFPSGRFGSVVSVYNLEHIPDLQSVFREVHRVLEPGGQFLIALPCEGGLVWNLGRELTTRRALQRKYRINYDKIIAYEHVWDLNGVVRELVRSNLFSIQERSFLPFRIPSVHLNVIACIECARH